MKLPYIIKKPVITEQSLKATKDGEFTFEVDVLASKGQIKEAIETYFDVDVTRVRTSKLSGKTKRVGKLRREIKKTSKKKAIIKIKKGQTIKLFDVQE
ncbi:50S ribosomal protein L23 [Patescibacteria group bacterium]